MAIKTARISVAQAPVRLSFVDTDFINDSEIIVRPSATIAVGGRGVTFETGFIVTANSEFAMSLKEQDLLYAVTESGEAVVQVLQAGV